MSADERPDAMVVMGQVLVPFGVRGWIKVRPFTQSADTLLDYPRWWVKPAQSSDWREMSRVDGRVQGDTLVAQLAGIDTREAATALRGAQVAVPRSMLPQEAEEEIYWRDLVGLDVISREGTMLGRVIEVQDFGAQPILRVQAMTGSAPREHLIPFVAAHVIGVDLVTRRIEVDWRPDYV